MLESHMTGGLSVAISFKVLGDPFKKLRNSGACLSNMTVDRFGLSQWGVQSDGSLCPPEKRSLEKDKRGLF